MDVFDNIIFKEFVNSIINRGKKETKVGEIIK